MAEPEQTPASPEPKPGRGWLAVVQSVGAALIGVQSAKNRERDFESGKPGDYILIGIIAVALFVLTLVGIVKWILADAGL